MNGHKNQIHSYLSQRKISNEISQIQTSQNTDTMYCIVHCLTSPPTQYRLYGRRFLQVKRPNQQHRSTEGCYKGKNTNNAENI